MPIRIRFGPSASLPCSCAVITGKVYLFKVTPYDENTDLIIFNIFIDLN